MTRILLVFNSPTKIKKSSVSDSLRCSESKLGTIFLSGCVPIQHRLSRSTHVSESSKQARRRGLDFVSGCAVHVMFKATRQTKWSKTIKPADRWNPPSPFTYFLGVVHVHTPNTSQVTRPATAWSLTPPFFHPPIWSIPSNRIQRF